MKIENSHLNQTPIQRPENSHPVSGAGQSQASEKSKRSEDRADLSERARLLAQAHSAIENIPADQDRDTRVEELRDKVSSGSYTVPVKDLARKLLERLTSKTTSKE